MKRILLIAFLLCFFNPLTQAQKTASITETIEKFSQFHNQLPREKVYLHLDKSYYSTNEEIWFKAYLTIGNFNQLSSLSKILYIELINPINEVVKSVRLPVVSGITYGNISVSDTLSEGSYRLRAYSNWMRNFDEGYFFEKIIFVGDALAGDIKARSTSSIKLDGREKEIESTLTFFNSASNVPINQAKVDYAVFSAKKSVHKGRETTNENGELLLNFKEPKGGFSNPFIQAEVYEEKKKTVKRFPLILSSDELMIDLYPENGAKLIAGVTNKIITKARKQNGRGVDLKGVLKDAGNNTITTFETGERGIGSFSFFPEKGQVYRAEFELPDGTTKTVELPEVSDGVLIKANTWAAENIFIQLTKSDQAAYTEPLNLLLQREGQVFYAAKVTVKEAETTIRIPKDMLPPGLVEVSVLTDSMQLMAFKNIFVDDKDFELPLKVTTNKNTYKQRDSVSVRLKTGNDGDSVRVATLSVSVIDLEKVPVDSTTKTSISSYLNLVGETTAYIQSPSYYFQSAELSIKAQLDDLVSTFGRDSIWDKINMTDSAIAKFRPEQDLQISGTILRLNGKPAPFAKVLILASDKGAVLDTVADENGRFVFDRLLFYEDTKFVVQARDEKGRKNIQIVLDEIPNQQVTKNKNIADVSLSVDKSMEAYLKNTRMRFDDLIKAGKMDNSYLLDEVDIEVTKKNPAEHSSNLNGPGNADQVLGEDALSMCSDLTLCLQGRLMGVIFKDGVPYSTRSQHIPMQIIVDGMYLSEDALRSISTMDVASVEVLRRPGSLAVYGSMAPGGAIIITTKRGDGSYRDLHVPGIVTYSPQGLYEPKTFESPDYSTSLMQDVKDLRSTIYWNPNIVTDDNGEASFSFYTADTPGRYLMVIEGIDLHGRTVTLERYLEIVE